jgi:hypothetical protein
LWPAAAKNSHKTAAIAAPRNAIKPLLNLAMKFKKVINHGNVRWRIHFMREGHSMPLNN